MVQFRRECGCVTTTLHDCVDVMPLTENKKTQQFAKDLQKRHKIDEKYCDRKYITMRCCFTENWQYIDVI